MLIFFHFDNKFHLAELNNASVQDAFGKTPKRAMGVLRRVASWQLPEAALTTATILADLALMIGNSVAVLEDELRRLSGDEQSKLHHVNEARIVDHVTRLLIGFGYGRTD